MNEREEMEAEKSRQNEQVSGVRAEMARMVAGCRSIVMLCVTPTGEMVTLCYYNGYADLRAIQVESIDRIREIIDANSKRVPSQTV